VTRSKTGLAHLLILRSSAEHTIVLVIIFQTVNVHVSSRRYCRGHFSIYRIATSLPANESLGFTAGKEKMYGKRTLDLVRLIELVRDNKILRNVRSEEYKLTERKPSVWKELADKLGSDSS
jgi:hypothetical protein